MNPFTTAHERLMQLLADEATEGLSGSGHDELEQAMSAYPDIARDGLELAAAAVALAMIGEIPEELPHRLRAKLRSSASHFVANRRGVAAAGPVTVIRAHESQWV